ncbi:MAG: glycosyltransferase family 2 protein [Bryobacteraceae bacterium]
MQPSRVIVVIPTLAADHTLWECVESLHRQIYRDFCIVIVDNSANRRTESNWPSATSRAGVTVLHPETNIGFGAAVNLAAREAPSEFVAVINDDAAAEPEWLTEMVAALTRHPRAGSAAAQVRLHGVTNILDSAGMLIAADGTSKQRGHGEPSERFAQPEEVLLPSGSASMYRSAMLNETGGFDDSFFLYCEDTDLGLRARWAGWTCRYVPSAIVHHRYSHSAGRSSRLKAYFVERNRLLLIAKNFPSVRILKAFAATPVRYLHHILAMRRGHGAAANFQRDGGSAWTLIGCVLRAHFAATTRLPQVWRQRRAIQKSAKIAVSEFEAALSRYSISMRQVAEQ